MRAILILYFIAVAYSCVRYLAFAPQNLGNLPIFVLNKGISMAAAFCFALAFWAQLRERLGNSTTARPSTSPAAWFRAGVFGVVVHIPISLVILSPAYFEEFFLDGRLSFNGESVFLFGALTAGGIWMLHRTSWEPRHRWALSLATMLALFSHTLCMGIARGLHINRSHAFLPPMWVLSLVGISFGIAFLVFARPPRTGSDGRP